MPAASVGTPYTHKKQNFITSFFSFEELPEVLRIQGTWNKTNQASLLHFKGYKVPISYRRKDYQNGGGVAIFVLNMYEAFQH